jgi:cysteine desulfurase
LCRERGVAVHTDAAQAVGKMPVNTADLGVDLLSVAGHKLYAPKGVGALFLRDGLHIEPQIRGAGHEGGRRAGTENVLLAVGLGTACDLAHNEVEAERGRFAGLRDQLASRLRESRHDPIEHGHREHRLPNTLSVAFPGCVADELLESLADELAASAGAACHAGAATVSHVLQAMDVDPEIAAATVRLSVGRFTTEDEIDRAGELILKRLKV